VKYSILVLWDDGVVKDLIIQEEEEE